MAGFEHKKVYPVPGKGYNAKLSPLLLRDDEAAVLQNAQVNELGLLEKYPGYIKDGAPFPNSADSFTRMLLNLRRGSNVDVLLMSALDAGSTNATYKVDTKKTAGDGVYSYIGHTTGTATFTSSNTSVVGVGTAWLTHL